MADQHCSQRMKPSSTNTLWRKLGVCRQPRPSTFLPPPVHFQVVDVLEIVNISILLYLFLPLNRPNIDRITAVSLRYPCQSVVKIMWATGEELRLTSFRRTRFLTLEVSVSSWEPRGHRRRCSRIGVSMVWTLPLYLPLSGLVAGGERDSVYWFLQVRVL
ncbi:hypothetical protein BJY04DRAFT_5387 [Aspergillus karnatakaensis]|uniref:uncharacterized protein n=1 Tax=Aspergillus karnatakaensis TaxID=1810916 RepID=UPI003CCD6E69